MQEKARSKYRGIQNNGGNGWFKIMAGSHMLPIYLGHSRRHNLRQRLGM